MRNAVIDLGKFIVAIIICMYHFYFDTSEYWLGGAIGVSYFVLVSVVFLLDSWERKKDQIGVDYPIEFFKKRFMRFFPYTTVAFICTFFVKRLYINYATGVELSFKKIITWLSGDIWEILLVDMIGLNDGYPLLNVPVWTVSAMLLSEFLIIICLVYSEHKFANIIAPLSMMIGFGMWRFAESASHKLWAGFTTYGMIRVFVTSCLGYYLWRFYKLLKHTDFTQYGRRILTAVEIICYMLVVPMMYYFSSYNFLWVATLIMIPAIAISVSGKSNTTKYIRSSKFTCFLGELSFSIYLTHYFVLYLFQYFWSDPYQRYEHVYLFIIIVLVVGIIFCFIFKAVVQVFGKVYNKLKLKMIAA